MLSKAQNGVKSGKSAGILWYAMLLVTMPYYNQSKNAYKQF